MFCCLLSTNTSSSTKKQNDEKQRILTTGTTINYRTVFPYANAITDDIIQVESSNVVDANATDALLFNGEMPDRTSQPLSFDDHAASATKSNNDQCLLERFFSINHVFSANSSTNISMSANKSPKNTSSNAVPQARPFDEFALDITSTSIMDGPNFDTPKSDKD